MDIIYLLIPIALVLLVVAVAAFFWAVRNDQFDDLDREASRILFEEGKPAQRPKKPARANTTPEPSPPKPNEPS